MIYEMLSGINPFKLKNKNKIEKMQMITDRDIPMRPEFSDAATGLLMGLLKRNVSTFKLFANTFSSLVNVWDRRASTTSSVTSSSMALTGRPFTRDHYPHHSYPKSKVTSTCKISTRCSPRSSHLRHQKSACYSRRKSSSNSHMLRTTLHLTEALLTE